MVMSRFDILGKEEAIEKIIGFIQGADAEPIWSNWYVGITENPSRRLYEEHRASISGSTYVVVESERVARGVEKFLIETYGMGGNPGGGDNPRFVYAFKMRTDTEPPLK
jgi:hypothetical protein